MRILVAGLGSIGARHFDNFKLLGHEVAAYSRRASNEQHAYSDLCIALSDFKPSHVVIANETSGHGSVLNEVLASSEVKKVLVEKPLYAFIPEAHPARTQDVSVAYNFRFHPMVRLLKEKIQGQKMIGWHSYVGQFLPSWRPTRDYRDVYSSLKSAGGGVLRDLSHEVDLFGYFAGEYELKASHGGHFSPLQSDVEDTYSILLSARDCPHANIHLNCIDKLGQRFLTVHTEEESVSIDLLSGKWRDSSGEKVIRFDRNDSYIEMSKAFLRNDKELCNYEQGLRINKLINQMESLL